MRVSVLIPTRDRPAKLAEALRRLRKQSLRPDRYEILVGLDGADPASMAMVRPLAESNGAAVRVLECERTGIAAVKNRLIRNAEGDLLVLINDDVQPASDFLEAHVQAQESAGGRAMILGASPWVTPPDETQFDRLIARSSMIFFYDRMLDDPDATRDWGFRHAWNLNLSVARRDVMAVGGFRPAIANCCYEDIELAYRLSTECGLPVLFGPEALAPHDHRYTPRAYLEREWRLGYSALGFALAAPECSRAVFHRRLEDESELSYARLFIERESAREADLNATFEALSARRADAWPGNEWIDLAYRQHLPLKRLSFLRGLCAAAAGERVDGLFHPRDDLRIDPEL